MLKATKGLLVLGIMTVLVLAAWASPRLASAQGLVAVVDLEKAVNECAQGKKANVELKRRADKLEGELKHMNEEVGALRKELENSAMLLKPEAKLAKERDFERKVRVFNDRNRDAQQEMQEARRDAFQPILREMTRVINEMGAKGGYSAILEARTALYYPKSAEITAQVIAAYDKLHP
jgi:outer membrane protein